MEDKAFEGDEVLLHCILQNYNGTKEVKNARLIEFTRAEVVIDEKFGDSYHNFGMEWTDDYIAFYIDGIRYYTYDCTTLEAADVFDQYSTIVFSAFSDRGYTGLPVPDDHKVSYNYVDWIRVWQKDEPGYGINIK